ncbi:RTA1 like protein-domain-containing protein [Auriculariales sp. MPI-PUGE-AT-0066]|nr:RTA1 like protein-domain-containing protein [Auriculariales sp. MPI-PUGE-AT-0066]
MSANSTIPTAGHHLQLYHYDPSGAAAILFAALFLVSTLLNSYQMIRTKTWYLIPFIIGGVLSTLGYIGRWMSSRQTPDWTKGPFIIQTLTLLVAPSLYAASIYMTLKRIISLVQAEHHSPIRMVWLTKLFVGGDLISFLLQAAGGTILSQQNMDTLQLGKNVILVGLFSQLIFFALFGITAVVFHLRVLKRPTRLSETSELGWAWRKHLYTLYFMSGFIFVRCMFRIIEYIQGTTGNLMSHEIYMYIFDGFLMIVVSFTLNVIHPSEIDALAHGGMVSRVGGFRMVFVQSAYNKLGTTELMAMSGKQAQI